MTDTTLYHNPRCSKSRQTLAALEERGIEATVVSYIESPPAEATLRDIVAALDAPATALIRTGDTAFVDSGLDVDGMDDDDVVGFLRSHPSAMQRPVVVHGVRARLGRPPEHALALFDNDGDSDGDDNNSGDEDA
jgi:arsenate reductase (glutaredoxin)